MDSIVEPQNGGFDRKRKRKVFRTRKQKRLDKEKREENRHLYPYSEIVKENSDFEYYYKLQGICKSDQEWKEFMSALRKSLPSSFRISSFCTGQSEKIAHLIQNDFINKITENEANNGEQELIVSQIPWYPNHLAWSFNMSKVEIRKTPALTKLHQFLVSETETGDISRQEAVSMIPPLLLDVKPGHSVLDMCAAPGSKTAQIIELLHSESNDNFLINKNSETVSTKKVLDGLVVANDVDNRRCYMLVHQSKRLHSPSVVIINHDASTMPNFYKTDQNGKRTNLKFDRILADVPCTGDGTLRKNYDVWAKWNIANSNNFHSLQLKIAKRGLELLAKDGLMAYSTCSLNPIEDEAVIANLLHQSGDSLELVDAAATVPELRCRPGLSTWTVMSRDKTIFPTYKDVPENLQSQIRESLFPPPNVESMNLNYCVRVLPHYQNTGGFFIAILRKKTDKMAWESGFTASEVATESIETKNVEKKPLRKPRFQGHREDPFYFFEENDADWPSLKSYYGFPDTLAVKQLAHRCTTGKRRNIYYLTEKAADFIKVNTHIKLITGGSRVFNRVDVQNIQCAFRITQEGIPSVFPFFLPNLTNYFLDGDSEANSTTFNIVRLDRGHFVKLIRFEDLKIEDFDKEYRTVINRLSHGCCILYVQLDRPKSKDQQYLLPICAWKGRNSIRAYVAKNERAHLLRLCDEPVSLDLFKGKGLKRSEVATAPAQDASGNGLDESAKRTKTN